MEPTPDPAHPAAPRAAIDPAACLRKSRRFIGTLSSKENSAPGHGQNAHAMPPSFPSGIMICFHDHKRTNFLGGHHPFLAIEGICCISICPLFFLCYNFLPIHAVESVSRRGGVQNQIKEIDSSPRGQNWRKKFLCKIVVLAGKTSSFRRQGNKKGFSNVGLYGKSDGPLHEPSQHGGDTRCNMRG